MNKLTLSIAAATLATAGVALAAPGMKPQGDVTRAQAEAMAGEHFAKMDVNSDGVLNAADREARQAQMFGKLDTDKNGAISEAEFAAHHGVARDGKRGDRAAMAGHRMDGATDGGKMGRPGGHRMGAMMMGRMADTDKDGTITRAEFTNAALTRFNTVDADKNGTVTQAERKAAHEAMRAKWQAKSQERRAARTAQ